MKHGCTNMNLREKYSTERGCQTEKTRLKSQRKIDLRKRYCARYSATHAVSCYKNHVKRRRASLGNTTESLLAEVNRFYYRVRPNAGMRGIKIFRDNASAHKCVLLHEYLVGESMETLPQPAYFLDLVPCDLSCSQASRNVLLGEDST